MHSLTHPMNRTSQHNLGARHSPDPNANLILPSFPQNPKPYIAHSQKKPLSQRSLNTPTHCSYKKKFNDNEEKHAHSYYLTPTEPNVKYLLYARPKARKKTTTTASVKRTKIHSRVRVSHRHERAAPFSSLNNPPTHPSIYPFLFPSTHILRSTHVSISISIPCTISSIPIPIPPKYLKPPPPQPFLPFLSK